MSATRVAIVDSGGANIASLTYALDRVGIDSILTRDAGTIRNASHVILPGVGAAADAMQRLASNNLSAVISGHSHSPSSETRGGVLYLNPGSAGPRRFKLPAAVARLHVEGDLLSSEIVELAV